MYPILTAAKNKSAQKVINVYLYYGRTINITMLTALGTIATKQSTPTQNTMQNVHQLLDYAATHPDAIIAFHASDMVLTGQSDAYYLLESKACSRIGGHFPLSNTSSDLPNNGAVLTVDQIIKAVKSSAAEAELGALYINFHKATPARHMIITMVNPQPPL